MNSINEYINELKRLKLNLKKSKNRIYEESYKIEKLERLAILKQSEEDFCRNNDSSDSEELGTEFDELHRELKNTIEKLNVKTEVIRQDWQEDSFPKMASFDISMVGKNLHVFKGSFRDLEDFVAQAELLHDLLKEEDKSIFIKYVYNFKLTAQVRSILGRSNRPTTFNELKSSLEKAFPNPRTLQQVLTELGTTKQNNSTISDFREKIAELSDQLNNFEIGGLTNPTQESKDAIYKMGDSVALNVFMKGVNIEYQPLLLANMPKTFNEAVERCMTAEKNLGFDKKSLFHVDSRFGKDNNKPSQYRNNNFRNNNYRNNHFRNENNRNNNYISGNSGNNNYRNYNGNNDSRNNNFRSYNSDTNNNFNNNYKSNGRGRNNNSRNNYNSRNNNNSYRSYNYAADEGN